MKRPWIPDVAGAALVVVLIALNASEPENSHPFIQGLGAVLLILSAPFMFLPFYWLSREGAPPNGKSYLHTTRVVDAGIYGIVRHPQYLGYCLFLSGLAVRRQSPLALLVAAAAIALFGWQMVREEEHLVATFGHDYRAYAARVPRCNFVAGIHRYLRDSRRSQAR